MFMSDVTKETLLPLTMTWFPLRMWVARYWNEALSIKWNTCCRLPNTHTPSSGDREELHEGGGKSRGEGAFISKGTCSPAT